MRYKREWPYGWPEKYIDPKVGYFEVVPWVLYSTKTLYLGEQRIHFFDHVGPAAEQTNMYYPGMLPEPESFLIEKILLFGIASDLALGEFMLLIGSKIYQRSPAWLRSVRPLHGLTPPIVIAPQMHFRADINWPEPIKFGKGLDGQRKKHRILQAAFVGQLARPIQ